MFPIQLFDYPYCQIGGIANVEEGGKLRAGLPADFEYIVEFFLSCDLANHYSDVIEKLTGDHDHAFVEDLEFGRMISLMFAFERGILMMFDEETLVILMALLLLTGGILHFAPEVAEFHLEELKGFRTWIPEQCFACLTDSFSLRVGKMVRFEGFRHVDGREMGLASLEGWAQRRSEGYEQEKLPHEHHSIETDLIILKV